MRRDEIVSELLERHGLEDDEDVLTEEEAWVLIRESYGSGYGDALRDEGLL